MKLYILGCDGSYPAANGACSGYLLSNNNQNILLDCGAGVFSHLLSKTDPAKLSAILITHSHADHTSDLMVLRYYLESRMGESDFLPLPIYLPKDPDSPIFAFLRQSKAFEFRTIQNGDNLVIANFDIAAGPARHPAPGVSYKVNGFVYTGDTNTVIGMDAFCEGASSLLACGPIKKQDWTIDSTHYSAEQAAILANAANVQALIITHIRPDSDKNLLLSQAKEVFINSILARIGDVHNL